MMLSSSSCVSTRKQFRDDKKKLFRNFLLFRDVSSFVPKLLVVVTTLLSSTNILETGSGGVATVEWQGTSTFGRPTRDVRQLNWEREKNAGET